LYALVSGGYGLRAVLPNACHPIGPRRNPNEIGALLVLAA
jgi:hypothetical protein